MGYAKHCIKLILACNNIYRSYSGVCNNKQNPSWGSENSCLFRILPANYGDNNSKPVEGPKVSELSMHLKSIPKDKSPHKLSNMFFAFGQFVDHDVANSVISEVQDEDCCLAPATTDTPCSMPIDVSQDPFYKSKNVTCLNFVRAARCPCNSGPRDQINAATSYIDLSHVYGSDEFEANYLQESKSHLMRMTENSLLPTGRNFCESEKCFDGADKRINQQAALTSMHTLFVRNHNLIAGNLRNRNPTAAVRVLYEEARKINIAQFQVILFNEFLPALLGNEILELNNLTFTQMVKGTVYNKSLQNGMFNEFLTAAFRLHTLIPEYIGSNLSFNYFRTEDFFEETEDFTTTVVESLVETQNLQLGFPASDQIAHHVYDTNGQFGLDLIAINIQRGRDHGIRPYVDYVRWLHGKSVSKFNDLHFLIDFDRIEILKKMYETVHDIDFYVGGQLERKYFGVLGPTMAAIIVKQFKLLVDSDRFFFTHKDYLTPEQYEHLAETTLSEVLCATTNLERIAGEPFTVNSKTTECSEMRQFDYSLWNIES